MITLFLTLYTPLVSIYTRACTCIYRSISSEDNNYSKYSDIYHSNIYIQAQVYILTDLPTPLPLTIKINFNVYIHHQNAFFSCFCLSSISLVIFGHNYDIAFGTFKTFCTLFAAIFFVSHKV